MARKRYRAEEIIAKLRKAEVLLAQGMKVAKADEEKEEVVRAGLGSHGVRGAQSCHIESAATQTTELSSATLSTETG